MEFNDLVIRIDFNIEESKEKVESDLNALMNVGVDNLIKNHFMKWLLGEDFKDRDPDKVLEGLKLYEISYHYGKICEQYSPTGKEDMFGQFELCFESGNEYTADILEAVAMQVYLLNGEVVKVSGFDI